MSGEVKDPKLVLGVELDEDEEVFGEEELAADSGTEDGEEVASDE